jgi:ABC-type polysaccharide/polyol phosphate export permease
VVWREGATLLAVARHSRRRAYAGTAAGAGWAVLSALLPFVVIGVVFSVALRVRLGGAPYLLGFAGAYVAWVLIADVVTDAASSLVEHRFLVKRVPFPVGLLPAASLLTNSLPHAVLVGITAIVVTSEGYAGAAIVTLVYYYVAALALCLGVGLALAPVTVVLRDASRTVPLLLQMWFWATPVAWDPERAPQGIRALLHLNPAAYVVTGYRHALMPGAFAAPSLGDSLIFWAICGALLAGGVAVYRRLRPRLWECL